MPQCPIVYAYDITIHLKGGPRNQTVFKTFVTPVCVIIIPGHTQELQTFKNFLHTLYFGHFSDTLQTAIMQTAG